MSGRSWLQREGGMSMGKQAIPFAIIALLALALWAPKSEAYPTYSEGKVTNPAGEEEAFGNCKTCHGHFRATDEDNSTPYLRDAYIALTDGKLWREIYTEVDETEPVLEIGLHDIHRNVMLDKLSRSRCDTCHQDIGRYPVLLNESASSFLEPISCMGCHGRWEDAGNDNLSEGLGAGLRQHHTNSGVTECKTCHADADPANYTPVGENVSPPYYFTPDPEFPNKPTDPCNQHGEEDYVGIRQGLDNDGDGKYDQADLDCRLRSSGKRSRR
jgi:hypothetical protein